MFLRWKFTSKIKVTYFELYPVVPATHFFDKRIIVQGLRYVEDDAIVCNPDMNKTTSTQQQ